MGPRGLGWGRDGGAVRSLELVTDRPELMAREPRTGEPADQARIVCRVCAAFVASADPAPCWRVRAKAKGRAQSGVKRTGGRRTEFRWRRAFGHEGAVLKP